MLALPRALSVPCCSESSAEPVRWGFSPTKHRRLRLQQVELVFTLGGGHGMRASFSPKPKILRARRQGGI